MSRRDLNEEQIHALPDYTAITEAVAKYHDALTELLGDDDVDPSNEEQFNQQVDVYAAWVERHVGDLSAIEHVAHHRFTDLGPISGVPFPIALLCRELMLGMWKDAFITGALFQKARTEELTSIVIPDSLEGLA
ncbi:MAG TPA: hypothetical protein VFH56_02320 [Acidimicrobiales bacterium]|nr:hypothetical protein [Acidimicrobiales bacterium]